MRRKLNLHALFILVLLQFLGNLASIPLLQATNQAVEPLAYWVFYTVLSFFLIVIGLLLAGRAGLGAPLLEGLFKKAELSLWLRRTIATSLLFTAAGSLLVLMLNLNANPDRVPAAWKMVLASVDAGIQEEIFYRLLLMSFFVWIGGLIKRGKDGRPTETVYWTAIILSGFIFGWAHIDDQIPTPAGPVSPIALTQVMTVNSILGFFLGWIYWKYGLESAMLAHFLLDAVALGIVVPVYLSGNWVLLFIVFAGLVLTAAVAWLCMCWIRRKCWIYRKN